MEGQKQLGNVAMPAKAATSTGPRTAEGKAASSRNAWQGGFRPFMRDLAKRLREQDKARRELLD
ncbi:hypothetical protein ACE0DR_13730 [Azotobacter sp. CWF10]